MGKKNTTRQRRMSKRNTRKLTKRNRSRKTRGGGDIGERIDFSKILDKINKKISYVEMKFSFCTALHVCILDEKGNDTRNGFFFFYNYTPQNDAKQNRQSLGRNAAAFIPKIFGKVGTTVWNAAHLSYKGVSKTAWIQSQTAKFLKELENHTYRNPNGKHYICLLYTSPSPRDS